MRPCQTQFNLCSNVWNILMDSYVWSSDGWLDINIHTNLLNACANYKPKGIYTQETWYNIMATVKQHPPVHYEGWMISGQETVFCEFKFPS